jgi:hypothetical protein
MENLLQYATGTADVDATSRKYFVALVSRETAGSTARVTVRNGSATGTIVFDRYLSANANDTLDPGMVQFPDGIFVKVESGAVRVTLLTA